MFVYQIIKVLVVVSFGVTVSHLNDPLNEEGTLSRQKRAANGWTQAQQNILLEEHNKLRRGEGAMDMYQLTWHDKLAESAQALADSCVYKHDVKVVTGNEYDTMNIGQNMYMDLLVDNPAQIVSVWFAEKRDYNYAKNTCTTGRDCGHYTAVIWATTLHVGCGYKLCSKLTASDTQKWENAHFAVCNYGPGGNKKGTDGTVPVPYKAGKSCARCPSGVGWCTNGLCNAGCKAASSTCACSTVCARGAATDPSTCKCKCPAGYVGNFCTEECVDAKPDYCAETIHAAEDDCNADVVGKTNADIAKRDCMATCHVCVALTKDNKVEDKTDLTAPKTEEPVTTTKSTPTDGKGTGDKPTDGTGTDNKTSTGTNGTDDKTPTGTNGTDVKPTDGKDTGEKPTAATTAAPIPIEPESESDMSIIMEMDAYLSDWSKIWVNLRRLVAASTNDLCNSEPANCCGGGVNTPTTNEVYIKESDVHSAANYPKEIGTGTLEIMLYIKPSENSAACKKLGGTMSRKKRITGQAQIPQDVLLKAINQNMETIKKEMQACCNVEVKQVKAAPKTVAGRPSSLEGWEIALIVISVIGVLVVVAVMAFYMYKKHRMRKNKLNVSEKVSDRHGKSRDNPHTTVM